MVEQPQQNLPKFDGPQSSVPEFDEPQPNVPEFDEPQQRVHEFDEPQPRVPEFDEPQPRVPEFDDPQPRVPEFDEPQPRVPEFDEPQPRVPEFDEPQPSVPHLEEPQQSQHLIDQPLVHNSHLEQQTVHRDKLDVSAIELEMVKDELKSAYDKFEKSSAYSIHKMPLSVFKMETGLPSTQMFWILVWYLKRFERSIKYHLEWNVTCIPFEDQVFMTLMKLRQNYTNLHLAQLFNCSSATVTNIFLTFIEVIHTSLHGLMEKIPSRFKNLSNLPESFKKFPNCRIIIDCTDVRMETPKQMNYQNQTYSSYRGMNSFKVLIGVAPNGVITYVSELCPGSVSDRVIVGHCGLLDSLESGDLIIADKGFLIHDMLPQGVSLNIPPFLYGKFSRSEAEATKDIARCRIHVERAIARIKKFKILHCVPHSLRCYMDIIVQVIATLVNLQPPLIKSVNVNGQ